MKSSTIATWIFCLLFFLLLVGVIPKSFRINRKDLRSYYKEKTARRGFLRQARENKKSLSFSQQRFQVLRSLWFDEKDGLRRQFHLQASMALVDLTITPKEVLPKETFLRPHGWLQEKIGWMYLPTKEEAEPHAGKWRRVKTKLLFSEKQAADITPFQTIRYYDAAKAIWDIQANTVTLFQVHFIDYQKNDHTTVFDVATAQVLLKGYAEEMSFTFKEGGKESISSKGLKMQVETKGDAHRAQ